MTPRHLLIAMLVPVTWGFGFALAKGGLSHFPPLLLMGMRFAIAALVLVWFVPLPRGHWRSLTLIALISATFQYGLSFSGLAMIDATPAILLVQSEVVFGTLIAAIMLKELPTRRQLAGTGVALVGIVTIVGAPSLTGQMTGVVLILTGCLCWALGQVMVRRLGDVMSGFQMTAWVGTIAAPQMLLASVLIEGNPLPALAAAPPFAWVTVLYLGVVMTAIGYSAWYFLLSKYPVPMVMPLLLLLPISTILGAITFLGEHPDPHVLLGGAIVVSGVSAVIVEPAQFRRLFRRSDV
ncbi:MAG: EamA family transporter [Alphaproteobacteria bacterium]|nr:EamA family transporter [Alphaproteobacteria bacterium]